jgi:hypothetical protein
MRARPEEVYASRRAPAMRVENCNCNFQAKVSECEYFPVSRVNRNSSPMTK